MGDKVNFVGTRVALSPDGLRGLRKDGTLNEIYVGPHRKEVKAIQCTPEPLESDIILGACNDPRPDYVLIDDAKAILYFPIQEVGSYKRVDFGDAARRKTEGVARFYKDVLDDPDEVKSNPGLAYAAASFWLGNAAMVGLEAPAKAVETVIKLMGNPDWKMDPYVLELALERFPQPDVPRIVDAFLSRIREKKWFLEEDPRSEPSFYNQGNILRDFVKRLNKENRQRLLGGILDIAASPRTDAAHRYKLAGVVAYDNKADTTRTKQVLAALARDPGVPLDIRFEAVADRLRGFGSNPAERQAFAETVRGIADDSKQKGNQEVRFDALRWLANNDGISELCAEDIDDDLKEIAENPQAPHEARFEAAKLLFWRTRLGLEKIFALAKEAGVKPEDRLQYLEFLFSAAERRRGREGSFKEWQWPEIKRGMEKIVLGLMGRRDDKVAAVKAANVILSRGSFPFSPGAVARAMQTRLDAVEIMRGRYDDSVHVEEKASKLYHHDFYERLGSVLSMDCPSAWSSVPRIEHLRDCGLLSRHLADAYLGTFYTGGVEFPSPPPKKEEKRPNPKPSWLVAQVEDR